MSNETFESVFGKKERERIDKEIEKQKKIEKKEHWYELSEKILETLRLDGNFIVTLKDGSIIYDCDKFGHEVFNNHVWINLYDEAKNRIAKIRATSVKEIK